MTDLVLVRHGETIWHADNRYAGRTDVALTRTGRAQAARLAAWAGVAGLEAIWCSPLLRARETAEAAASGCGLVPQLDPRLCELDFGDAEGLTVAEMRRRFPDAVRGFESDPVINHLPGGEDPRDAVERGLAALEEIGERHPSGRVLVVTHTTLIRLMTCCLLGLSIERYRSVFPFVRNVGLTEVRRNGAGVSLLQFNAELGAT